MHSGRCYTINEEVAWNMILLNAEQAKEMVVDLAKGDRSEWVSISKYMCRYIGNDADSTFYWVCAIIHELSFNMMMVAINTSHNCQPSDDRNL